jgi:Flp pilus assembly CpaE family ATPase
VISAAVSQILGTKHVDTITAERLKVALIGPDEKRRSTVAKALAGTRQAVTLEYDSYPPETDHLQELLASFDVIILDLDSDPDVALGIVGRMCTSDTTTTMVYSKNSDPKQAIRMMRAGAREYLLLPLERGAVAEALDRAATTLREKALSVEPSLPVEKALPVEKTRGELLVFAGSKGGAGVTTVTCNMAIALAQNSNQSVLLIDFALPIGDAALCLGISAGYSTEDALRSIDRMDASFLQNLAVGHRSGVFVLAAPTKVPEVEVSKSAIDKLIAVARREFDHVIVDVGSRIDAAAKALFEDASTIYLVTQAGISELRNANHLISQFFAEGSPNLEIVINRFESRFLETVNEDVIVKALGRPVRWKIPDDQDAARALQYGETGLPETRISRISLEMASSITGRPLPQGKKRDPGLKGPGGDVVPVDSGNPEPPSTTSPALEDTRTTPTITWPTPELISYGSKLTFAQLNATASVKGTLLYTPGPGYVLPAGMHTLWVTFTPIDSAGYVPLQAATLIVVAKATPALSLPTPAEIIYGTALDDAQLNASASIPGRFEYSPARGAVLPPGTHTLSVTFIPAENANYATTLTTVSLSVVRTKSKIQWSMPDPITYGAQLSATQLCAESSVPGSFAYNPKLGAVLAAGNHKLSAVFNPEDAMVYATSQTAVSLTVAKAIPAVTWPTPDPIAYGTALSATELNAKSTVTGSFTFTPAAGEILEPGVNELSVAFTPTDTLNYTTVSAVVSLTVTEKLPTLITWPVPSQISYGAALSDIQLNATASVPGTFVYTPAAAHVLAPGRYTLSASFTPSDIDKYATAQAAVVLEVEGSPEIASLPTAAAETPSATALDATKPTPGGAAPAEVTGEQIFTETKPRETRMYKGAVYEKGEDGQWHLQKK